MHRFFLLLGLVLFFQDVHSQKIPLVHSGETMAEADVLYDSGKYGLAIEKYLTIPKRDTNYVYMLSELALAYIADEKYDKALEVCKEGLQKPMTYKSQFLLSRAVATEKSGKFDEAVSLFNKAIEEFPFDFRLIYNLGLAYYNQKDYVKATDYFFKTLAINPFHSGSHLNLGRIAIGRGRKTQAMLSMGMYLGVNNQVNSQLVYLNDFVSNQVKEEGTIPGGDEPNIFGKLDQIIKAKLAMDKSFKSTIPVDAAVVRQFELLFQQLTPSDDKSDRWNAYYVPIYIALREKNNVEPFIYHILASASNELVKKWRKKNEKTLTAFYDVANTAMSAKREMVTPPTSLGFDKPVQGWYANSNRIEAIGNKKGDKRSGRWVFFHSNFTKSGEGSYDDNGIKTGVWKYYYDDGALKSDENYKTGEVTVFYPSGAKHQHFYLKGEDIDGDVSLYYPCGPLKETFKFSSGKRSGENKLFSTLGKLEMQGTNVDGKLAGELMGYHSNGKVSYRKNFKDGNLNGKYEEFHPNGKIKILGEQLDDAPHGLWKYYYSNGRLEKTGTFQKGLAVGQWDFYDVRGNHTETRNFNAAGKWHGDNIFYYEGKKHIVQTFKDDVLVNVVYFDPTGKELGKYGAKDGSFSVKVFYGSGDLNAEGAFKKGKKHGKWTYYFHDGQKQGEYMHVDGLLQGEAVEYYSSGEKKYTLQYKDGELHGYFQEWHSSGRVKSEGWFQRGLRQQQWLNHYDNGAIESDYYYLNGDLMGDALEYNTDGKLASVTTYDRGAIEKVQYFNAKGALLTTTKSEGGKKVYENKFANGKTQSRLETLCGNYTNIITKSYPDGTPFFTSMVVDGKRDGQYKAYDISGKVTLEGMYINGDEEGVWKSYFTEGEPHYIGYYLGGERDSTWTYYFPNGKKSMVSEYQNNERHGLTQFYTPEGTLVTEKMYDRGDVTAYRTLDKTGQFGNWTKFAPSCTLTAYYPNGQKAYEETYNKGVFDGARRIYYSQGKLYSEYFYVLGDYQGTYTLYFPNGKVMERGNYDRGSRQGKVEWFKESGTLMKEENYVFDVMNGKSVYYKNGAKVKEVEFWAGVPAQ